MKKLALCGAIALFGASAAFAHAAPPAPPAAASPAAVTPKAGDIVYDKAGEQAGSVESVNGNVVVVATEQGKGSMPLTEFTMSDKGLTLSHTKAELEAAIRNASAAQATPPAASPSDGAAPKAS